MENFNLSYDLEYLRADISNELYGKRICVLLGFFEEDEVLDVLDDDAMAEDATHDQLLSLYENLDEVIRASFIWIIEHINNVEDEINAELIKFVQHSIDEGLEEYDLNLSNDEILAKFSFRGVINILSEPGQFAIEFDNSYDPEHEVVAAYTDCKLEAVCFGGSFF